MSLICDISVDPYTIDTALIRDAEFFHTLLHGGPMVDDRVASDLEQVKKQFLHFLPPQQASQWMNIPLPRFGGSTPRQLIERGETQRLTDALFQNMWWKPL